jgi:hypothetical protein
MVSWAAHRRVHRARHRMGEQAEEQTGKGGRKLLHAARLLRGRDAYLQRYGQAACDMMLGDCLWHVYGMIGKLTRRVYVVSHPGRT